MSISFRHLNTDSITALQNGIKTIRPEAQPLMRTMSAAFPIDKVLPDSPENGLPVYTLGLSEISNIQQQLNTIKQTGWLYLLDNDLTATVAFNQNADKHTFSSFNKGKLAEVLTASIKQLTENTGLQSKNYELCILHIPALFTYAIWLKIGTAATSDDLLVPVLSDQSVLTKGKIYDVQAFFKSLQQPVASLLKQPEM